MPLFIVFISVLILLGLIIAKCPPLIALLIVSVFAGLAQGMNPADVYHSVEQGIGSTLGSIAMVIALGAMFGKIIEDSGAAYQITTGLIKCWYSHGSFSFGDAWFFASAPRTARTGCYFSC